MRLFLQFWPVLFLGIVNIVSIGASKLHPVVLVPGDGGNQLEAKLNKSTSVHYICDKTTDDYFNIWLNLELLVPIVIDCWADNLRLVYNVTTRKTGNSPGVDIRVPGFGNSTVVEYLDPSKSSYGLYFYPIVQNALLPLGYERDISIRGAPYDFRKAPNELQDYLNSFKLLIQDTYEQNNQTSVILLCHSMGSPLSLYFLKKQSQSWKDKYIKSLITLGGPWGGSVKAWKVFAAGDDLGAYLLPSYTLRTDQRTFPSVAWLLPSKLFWSENEIIVSAAGLGNYTIGNYKEFFLDMQLSNAYDMWLDTKDIIPDTHGPGVDTYCLYGRGVSTIKSFSYSDKKYFPDKPQLSYGDGDGTVNLRSLRGCLNWSSDRISKKSSVHYKEFPGVDHMAILSNSKVLSYVKSLVENLNTVI